MTATRRFANPGTAPAAAGHRLTKETAMAKSCFQQRTAGNSSFRPQSNHRSHFCRPSRRDVTREERHDRQQQYNRHKCRRVGRLDPKEQSRQDARQGKRTGRPGADAGEGEPKPSLQDEHPGTTWRRAERHSDADFAGPQPNTNLPIKVRSATRQKNPVIWPSFTYWLSHFKVQFGIRLRVVRLRRPRLRQEALCSMRPGVDSELFFLHL